MMQIYHVVLSENSSGRYRQPRSLVSFSWTSSAVGAVAQPTGCWVSREGRTLQQEGDNKEKKESLLAIQIGRRLSRS